MSEDEKIQRIEEKNLTKIEEKGSFSPLAVPMEIIFIFFGRSDLLGLYLNLWWISRMKLGFTSQPKLAKMLGISYLSYLKKRKELELLGLVEITIENHNLTKISVNTEKAWGLILSLRGSYKFYKTLLEYKNLFQVKEELDITRKLLIATLSKSKQLNLNPENSNIYNNISSIKSSNNINNNTSKQKYPREDYTLVLDAFQKYKGIKLAGPEIPQQLKAIKMMFQAERKPQEIIDCMKWFHDHQDDEETSWARNWTIWTVQKKIAEFVAGKLGSSASLDEEYPTYGR